MTSEHTPGPWKVVPDPLHFDSLSTVIGGERDAAQRPTLPLMVEVGGHAGFAEQEANARLIAAAPDMLRLLNEAFTPRGEPLPRSWGDVADEARALVRRVKGGDDE